MAKEKSLLTLFVFLVFLIGSSKVEASSHHHRHHSHHRHHGLPQKFFIFGDSYADTGNYRKADGGSWRVPYGITFPGKPAGRFSDGRVMTDFLAKYLGLRSPIPYRWRNLKPERQVYGINFAYGGTGVFDTVKSLPNMTVQIDLLEKLINGGLYSRQDLDSSLALVSVAGNDYTAYQTSNGSIQGLPLFIRSLIAQIGTNLRRLSAMGVRKIVVTAIEPLGCLPANTASFSYAHCNETFNNASIFHNQLLQAVADEINNHTNASTVVLLDLYGSFMSALHGQDLQGKRNFEDPLKPCCVPTSTGASCGSVDEKGEMMYTVCESPQSSFFWDRVHPSQVGWTAVIASLRSSMHSLTL